MSDIKKINVNGIRYTLGDSSTCVVELTFHSNVSQGDYIDILRVVVKEDKYAFLYDKYRDIFRVLSAELNGEMLHDLPVIAGYAKEYVKGTLESINYQAVVMILLIINTSNDVIYHFWFDDTPELQESLTVNVIDFNVDGPNMSILCNDYYMVVIDNRDLPRLCQRNHNASDFIDIIVGGEK